MSGRDLKKIAMEVMEKAERLHPNDIVKVPGILLSINEVSKLENDYFKGYERDFEAIPLNPDFPEVTSYQIKLGAVKYNA